MTPYLPSDVRQPDANKHQRDNRKRRFLLGNEVGGPGFIARLDWCILDARWQSDEDDIVSGGETIMVDSSRVSLSIPTDAGCSTATVGGQWSEFRWGRRRPPGTWNGQTWDPPPAAPTWRYGLLGGIALASRRRGGLCADWAVNLRLRIPGLGSMRMPTNADGNIQAIVSYAVDDRDGVNATSARLDYGRSRARDPRADARDRFLTGPPYEGPNLTVVNHIDFCLAPCPPSFRRTTDHHDRDAAELRWTINIWSGSNHGPDGLRRRCGRDSRPAAQRPSNAARPDHRRRSP